MTNQDMKLELQERLLESPYAKRVNNKQITVRCVFCGDSRKHHDSTHMSVKIDPNDDNEPILFHCFLCDMGGVLTPSILKEFEIRDLSLSSSLLSYSKRVKKKMKTLGIYDNNIPMRVPRYKIVPSEVINKKSYIENRLGIELTVEELYNLKTVFNLRDFIIKNDIVKPTVGHKKGVLITDNYVGFLSVRNEFIVFRNIKNDKNKRYEKYSVFKSLDNTRQFYSIPNAISLVTPEPIQLNIAEGVFDILGIFYHINNKDLHNKAYAAICGAGFKSVIKYFIALGIFGENVTLNIYSDSDRKREFYTYIIRDLSIWFAKVNIYYNSLGKDYGVHKEDIHITGG